MANLLISLQLFVSISGPALLQMRVDRGTSQVKGIVTELPLLQLMVIHYISTVFQLWMPTATVQ